MTYLNPTLSEKLKSLPNFYRINGFSWDTAAVTELLIDTQFEHGRYCGLRQLSSLANLQLLKSQYGEDESYEFIRKWLADNRGLLNPFIQLAIAFFWSELSKSCKVDHVLAKKNHLQNFFQLDNLSVFDRPDWISKILDKWIRYFLNDTKKFLKKENERFAAENESVNFSQVLEKVYTNAESKKLNHRQIYFLSHLKKIVFPNDSSSKRITNTIYKNIVNTTRESAKRDLIKLESLGFVRRDLAFRGRNAGFVLVELRA